MHALTFKPLRYFLKQQKTKRKDFHLNFKKHLFSKQCKVYSIFSSIIILFVILFVGPLFRTLPTACLSAIIVVALRLLMQEVFNVCKIYRKNKLEAVRICPSLKNWYFYIFLNIGKFQGGLGNYIFGSSNYKCGLWTLYRYRIFTPSNNNPISKVSFCWVVSLLKKLFSVYLWWIHSKTRARTSIIGNIPGTNIFECIDACSDVSFYWLVENLKTSFK